MFAVRLMFLIALSNVVLLFPAVKTTKLRYHKIISPSKISSIKYINQVSGPHYFPPLLAASEHGDLQLQLSAPPESMLDSLV